MIGRFARYAERRWNFLDILENVRDTRHNPSVPTSAVFLSVFGMHAVRHGSINALEQQLQIPGRWEPWVGPIKPSADTVAYAMERSDPEPLRIALADAARLANAEGVLRLYP